MMKSVLIIALMATTSAAAQEVFALPAGCDAFVTIQKRGCVVSHMFTCEADPEGHQRRVDMAEEGMTYIGRIDREAQWVESYQPNTGSTSRLGPNIRDAASLSQLLEEGRNAFDFETTSDIFGPTRFVGYDELTGNDIVLNGVTLLGTSFDLTAYGANGEELWSVVGNEFVIPEWRSFASGIRVITSPTNGASERNTSPVELFFPGDEGFLSSKPNYDCSVVLSRLEILQ